MALAASLPRPARRSAPSDDLLLARLRGGDEHAFEALVDRYHVALLGFCRHMLGSREEAEDVLQHVFLTAYRCLLSDDRPVALKPWLYAVARNRCVSVLRARRPDVALDAVTEPSASGLAVGAIVDQRADLRELLGDLARLPEDQRAALLLAEMGDLCHDEIAATLGVPREKVKALVFQARETLMCRRTARAADCREIQQELATARGAALRARHLRMHVETCGPCATFRADVERQRRAFAVLLPVVPGILLKKTITGAIGGGSAASAAGAGAGVAGAGSLLSTGIVAKGLLIVAIGGGAVALDDAQRVPAQPAPVRRVLSASASVHAAPSPRARPRTTPAARAPRRVRAEHRPAAAGAAVAERNTVPSPAPPQPPQPSAPVGATLAATTTPATPASAPRADGPLQDPPERAADEQAPVVRETTTTEAAPAPAGEQAATAPVQTDEPATPPGQANKPGVPPGQANRPTTPPGQANRPAVPPGQADKLTVPPGQADKPTVPPGHDDNAAISPGQAGEPAAPPGHADPPALPPGQANRPAAPPGQAHKSAP